MLVRTCYPKPHI